MALPRLLETTGVRGEWIHYSGSDYNQKLIAMLASDTAPDLIYFEAGWGAVPFDPEFGGDDDVEQWLDRASQWLHHPGDEDRGVTGGAMFPNPAYGVGREPAQDVRRH